MTHPIIFISYSHDDDAHCERVLDMSELLRLKGYETRLDCDVNGTPPEGWRHWLLNQLDCVDVVLIVCTPLYYIESQLDRLSNGARQGPIITVDILQHQNNQKKINFMPVVFEMTDIPYIPKELWLHDFWPPIAGSGHINLLNALNHAITSKNSTQKSNIEIIEHSPVLPAPYYPKPVHKKLISKNSTLPKQQASKKIKNHSPHLRKIPFYWPPTYLSKQPKGASSHAA